MNLRDKLSTVSANISNPRQKTTWSRHGKIIRPLYYQPQKCESVYEANYNVSESTDPNLINEIDRLISNVLEDNKTRVNVEQSRIEIEYVEETNVLYYYMCITIREDNTYIQFTITNQGETHRSEMSSKYNFFEKYFNQLYDMCEKRKHERFNKCLDKFYSHTGLDRKDKIKALDIWQEDQV